MSDLRKQPIPVMFYRTSGGAEPVKEWLLKLPVEHQRTIGLDLLRVQYQWPIGMPVCRSLGDGLWEVRSGLPDGTTARVIFFFADGRIGVVNGFIKKTQKTPDDELSLARRRMKDMMS